MKEGKFKNIILDVGGIIFDDSKDNIEKVLNKNCDYIYKISYGKNFKKCLLGEISVSKYINTLKNEKCFEYLMYVMIMIILENF